MVAVGITLQCFGTVLGPGFQGFLDGHTQDATLGLAPSIGDPFTGTMWSKDDSGTATTLQCLGFASDPRRFLDGHTQDATLGLAPTTDPPFTGTRWAMLQVPSVADNDGPTTGGRRCNDVGKAVAVYIADRDRYAALVAPIVSEEAS